MMASPTPTTIASSFSAIHIPAPDGDCQAAAFADFDGGVGSPHLFCKTQHVLGKRAQLVLAMDKQGIVHGRIFGDWCKGVIIAAVY
jgi:hypothetical protein